MVPQMKLCLMREDRQRARTLMRVHYQKMNGIGADVQHPQSHTLTLLVAETSTQACQAKQASQAKQAASGWSGGPSGSGSTSRVNSWPTPSARSLSGSGRT